MLLCAAHYDPIIFGAALMSQKLQGNQTQLTFFGQKIVSYAYCNQLEIAERVTG